MAEASRRVFLALWPDVACADRLDGLAASVHGVCGGRRMRLSTLHMTLAFIGNVADSALPRIAGAVDTVSGGAFEIQLDTLGFWHRQGIVWASCATPPKALATLAGALRRALGAVSIGVAGPDFMPHVTLLRKVPGPVDLPPPEPLVWCAREMVLVESLLGPQGAEYRRLGVWPLQ